MERIGYGVRDMLTDKEVSGLETAKRKFQIGKVSFGRGGGSFSPITNDSSSSTINAMKADVICYM